MGNEREGEHSRSGALFGVGAAGLGLEEEADEVVRWVGVGGSTVEVVSVDGWTLDVVRSDIELLEAVVKEDEDN